MVQLKLGPVSLAFVSQLLFQEIVNKHCSLISGLLKYIGVRVRLVAKERKVDTVFPVLGFF